MIQQPAGFFKRKTTWVSLGAIFGAIAAAVTGTATVPEAAIIVVQGALALTGRSAIAKLE